MKTLKLKWKEAVLGNTSLMIPLLLITAYLLWKAVPAILNQFDPTVGSLDGGIWQLLLFAGLAFMLLLLLCVVLMKWLIAKLALPAIYEMVSQFNTLELWQRFAFYWASFALLLLAGVLSLVAVF